MRGSGTRLQHCDLQGTFPFLACVLIFKFFKLVARGKRGGGEREAEYEATCLPIFSSFLVI